MAVLPPIRILLFVTMLVSCSTYFFAFKLYALGTKVLVIANPMVKRLALQKITTTTTDSSILLAEPLVDNSPALSESEQVQALHAKLPSLPIRYWRTLDSKFHLKNRTCAKFPKLSSINFNNIYWQTLTTSNGTFHLYGAYYDNRTLASVKPTIRMLGMITRVEPMVDTYCQFWFDGFTQPIFSNVNQYKRIWNVKWGIDRHSMLIPYIVSCQIPVKYSNLVPESVSLVEKPSDNAVTNLRVVHNKPTNGVKGDFAVCIKGMTIPTDDLSVRLVEWIETLLHLGAKKIFFYILVVHPNITKVLNYYQEKGLVDVTPLTLPGYQPNLPELIHMYLKSRITAKRLNEIIPYNDCLYKNMYRYRYISVQDIDEVIMPAGKNMYWKDLMNGIEEKVLTAKTVMPASFSVKNVYFFDNITFNPGPGQLQNIPQYMHIFRHIYRAQNHTKATSYIKCFHNPERVFSVHNHFPLSCLGGKCVNFPINVADAQLQHYRADCAKALKKSCDQYKDNTVLDDTIWRHKGPVIANVIQTLVNTGFLHRGSGTGETDT